jgi:epoxyqueuosine reductase
MAKDILSNGSFCRPYGTNSRLTGISGHTALSFNPMLSSLAVRQRALDLGFDLAGIAPLAVWKDLEFSRQWVEKGFHGEMRYLENPKRFDPRLVLPSVKSVVCVGLVYNAGFRIQESGFRNQNTSQGSGVRRQETEEKAPSAKCRVPGGECAFEREARDNSTSVRLKTAPAPSPQPPTPFFFNGQRTTDHGPRTTDHGRFYIFDFPFSTFQPRAWISRYAWGRDYHEIMRLKLEQLRAAIEGLAPGVETRVFVDTGPVVERAFARFSGIGWMGKNTCIINQEKGSWFFLGVILTSLEIEPDLPAPDRCGSCTACLEACPTGALVEPYVMDASRCISYFTIELKGSIPEQFRPKIGANVFGCDICQDVCPWNGSRQLSVLSYQQAPSVQQATDNGQRTTDSASFSLLNPPLDVLASISEDDFRRIFAHSPIKRTKYRGWLRNLCVAIGNSGDERFVPWLERAAQHPDPIVREHAAWALERLRGK